MIRYLLPALLLIAAPGFAQFEPTAEERLRALTAPPATDLYGAEKSADRSRIAADAPTLFAPLTEGARPAEIVLFVGPDCEDCDRARRELTDLANDLDVPWRSFSLENAEHRAMFERLQFDALPAYVLPDRLIQGHMPDLVLRTYLSR
ncbi:hypothetical protein J4E08_03175 [Sagittula sp. NFXS13]|uniref:hypothetical protein n=1 Tax=Sagittula sp. NFXS13 TaxID=2819095 RepID=UPI0032DF3253